MMFYKLLVILPGCDNWECVCYGIYNKQQLDFFNDYVLNKFTVIYNFWLLISFVVGVFHWNVIVWECTDLYQLNTFCIRLLLV